MAELAQPLNVNKLHNVFVVEELTQLAVASIVENIANIALNQMTVSFTLRVFAQNLLSESHRHNIFLYFV